MNLVINEYVALAKKVLNLFKTLRKAFLAVASKNRAY